jgi:hypothetical protein
MKASTGRNPQDRRLGRQVNTTILRSSTIATQLTTGNSSPSTRTSALPSLPPGTSSLADAMQHAICNSQYAMLSRTMPCHARPNRQIPRAFILATARLPPLLIFFSKFPFLSISRVSLPTILLVSHTTVLLIFSPASRVLAATFPLAPKDWNPFIPLSLRCSSARSSFSQVSSCFSNRFDALD